MLIVQDRRKRKQHGFCLEQDERGIYEARIYGCFCAEGGGGSEEKNKSELRGSKGIPWGGPGVRPVRNCFINKLLLYYIKTILPLFLYQQATMIRKFWICLGWSGQVCNVAIWWISILLPGLKCGTVKSLLPSRVLITMSSSLMLPNQFPWSVVILKPSDDRHRPITHGVGTIMSPGIMKIELTAVPGHGRQAPGHDPGWLAKGVKGHAFLQILKFFFAVFCDLMRCPREYLRWLEPGGHPGYRWEIVDSSAVDFRHHFPTIHHGWRQREGIVGSGRGDSILWEARFAASVHQLIQDYDLQGFGFHSVLFNCASISSAFLLPLSQIRL